MMFDFSSHNAPIIAHKEILCDNLTPLSVLVSLGAKVLLESAYNETGKDRYSIIILTESFRIYKDRPHSTPPQPISSAPFGHSDSMAPHIWLLFEGRKTPLQEILQEYLAHINPQSASEYDPHKQDFLESLSLIRGLSPNPEHFHIPSHLPLPLGGAGYMGYEFFAEIEQMHFCKPPLYDAPECAFIFGRDFLIFDHLHDRLHIVSVSYAYERTPLNPHKRVEDIIHTLQNLPYAPFQDGQSTYSIESATSEGEYQAMVKDIQDAIYRGDLLQCVPSQYMRVRSSLPPLAAYRNLRHQNPSPYMFYYDFDDFVILGASPEIMIRLKTTQGISHFILRPIAGTRPRGKSVAQDLELEQELLSDAKELSEHLMLLDLARNDAGKVSVGGGVKVLSRNMVERYSRVMHIVSSVQGELDSKRFTKADAFKAAFPAGTLTGAPKIEAIKKIEALESHSRGIYGGAIGYFSFDADMDFAIAIRTAVYQDGIYHLRSGAGVVYDSIPENEYIETQNKMRSMLDMLQPHKPNPTESKSS